MKSLDLQSGINCAWKSHITFNVHKTIRPTISARFHKHFGDGNDSLLRKTSFIGTLYKAKIAGVDFIYAGIVIEVRSE